MQAHRRTGEGRSSFSIVAAVSSAAAVLVASEPWCAAAMLYGATSRATLLAFACRRKARCAHTAVSRRRLSDERRHLQHRADRRALELEELSSHPLPTFTAADTQSRGEVPSNAVGTATVLSLCILLTSSAFILLRVGLPLGWAPRWSTACLSKRSSRSPAWRDCDGASRM